MVNNALTAYRNAYAGLSRETWVLSVVMLINRCGTMVVPFMSLYLTSPSMGYSIGQAGFVYGLFGAGSFIGAWLGGRMTDKLGFYPVQLFTLTGGGLLFILLGQMKTLTGICVFTFILSFVNEAFRPANSSAIAFYSREENRTRSYSLNRLAINLGWAIGSAIGGILAKYNYTLLFWVDGITNIAAAILMTTFLQPVGYRVHVHKESETVKRSSVWNDQIYMWFIFLTLLFALSFFQLFTNLSVYYKLQRHFSEPFIGSLMATNGFIIVGIEMLIVYRLEGRRKNTVYMAAGTLLMAVAYLLLNATPTNHLIAFAMVVVITFAEILAMPFMNSFWIGRSKPYNRGQYAALYTMAWSAAQTLGPMTGAQIAEKKGFAWLWWIVALLSLLTAGGFLWLHRKDTSVSGQPETEISPTEVDGEIIVASSEAPQV
jgi:predicted MFS family arabinose efflux permease